MRTPRALRRQLSRFARKREKPRPQFGLEPLEPRVLLSADPLGLEELLQQQLLEQDGGLAALVTSSVPPAEQGFLQASGDAPVVVAAGPVQTGINLLGTAHFRF